MHECPHCGKPCDCEEYEDADGGFCNCACIYYDPQDGPIFPEHTLDDDED